MIEKQDEVFHRNYVLWRDRSQFHDFPARVTEADDEEKLLEIMVAMANGPFSEVGDRYEIKDSDGTVLHRIDIQVIYTVRPKDFE
jgi:uncharacterized protein YxjI